MDTVIDLTALYDNRRQVRFARHEFLFREGENAGGLYRLQSGKAKLLRGGDGQKSLIIQFMKPGDLLGLSGFSEGRYAHSAMAIEALEAHFIPRGALATYLADNPAASFAFMRMMCRSIEEMETHLTGLYKKSARERVALRLLELQSQYGIDRKAYLNISLTRKDLANFAATSSETLSRIVHDFQERRLIGLNNKRIRLLDHQQLSEIARR